MNNFKHYAVALLSCVAVGGVAQATHAGPEAGFIKNGTEQQIKVSAYSKVGNNRNKLIDEQSISPKQKLQVDDSFNLIDEIEVTLGTSGKKQLLKTCNSKNTKDGMYLSMNTDYDTFEVTERYKGSLHIFCKNSAERHAEGFQDVREIKQQRPTRYKRVYSGRSAAQGCATCGEVVEPTCSTCGR